MHFFYLDESGDTGIDLDNEEQPIFVFGGVGINDQKWNGLQEELQKTLKRYFGTIPENFELHSYQLLSPRGEGFFEGHNLTKRLELVLEIINLIVDNGHSIHYFAIDKKILKDNDTELDELYESNNPYLISFDYMVTYLNSFVKRKLGRTARGMMIFDKKENYHNLIEDIMHHRRFKGAKAKRVKWIVEFSYAVDSKKNPMIQLSDLIIIIVRKFFEIENGYKDSYPDIVKSFYASCFELIYSKVNTKTIIERDGRENAVLNGFLKDVQCKPATRWKSKYNLPFSIDDV